MASSHIRPAAVLGACLLVWQTGAVRATDYVWTNSTGFAANVLELVIDPGSPQTVYAGTFGAGVYRSTTGGTSWAALGSGLGDQDVTALALATASGVQTLYVGTDTAGVFQTSGGSGVWTAASNGLTARQIETLAVDPTNPRALYVGTNGGGVYKTTDGALTWYQANAGMGNCRAFALAIDPGAPQTLYAAVIDQGIYKTTTGGAWWTQINNGLPSTHLTAVLVDPQQPQTLYTLPYPFGVYKSTNGGALWSAANGGLANSRVVSLAMDRTDPRKLYAGTYPSYPYPWGVFRTTDAGGSWTSVNTGLPSQNVYSLAVDPADGRTVYAGLWSAGVYSATFPAEAPSFAVAGRATLAGQTDHSGVSIAFTRLSGTGNVPAAAWTTAAGDWSAAGFANGSTYLATPSRTGWVFTPASVQLSGAASGIAFAGQRAPFAVSGRATLAGQTDHAGVTISFARVTGTGTVPAAVQTNATGDWSATGFETGSTYLATPSRAGWEFVPGSVIVSGDASGVNFAGQLPLYAVSGLATLAGQADNSGTTVVFTRRTGAGAVPAATQTVITGAWSAAGFTPGTIYDATPVRAGWIFEPESRSFSAATTSLTFAGHPPPYSVSGVVTLAGRSEQSGTTVTFTRVAGTGALPAPVTTDASGAWAAAGFDPGTTYAATPARTGWYFLPAAAEFAEAVDTLGFTGQEVSFAASGHVALEGQSDNSGVIITFARLAGNGYLPAAVSTDPSGAWSASGFGTGTVYLAIPNRSGWLFTPSAVELRAATSALDFAGAPSAFAASGLVTLKGRSEYAGTTVSFARVSGAGAIPAPVQTGATGAWSATGFQPGTVYRATPVRPNWVFAPAAADFAATTSNIAFAGDSTATGLLVRALVGSSRLVSPAQIPVGRRVQIQVLRYGLNDHSDSTAVASFVLQVPTVLGTDVSAGAFRLTTVAGVSGDLQVAAAGMAETFRITTVHGAVDHLAIDPQAVSLAPGEAMDFTARGVDSFGNVFALAGVNVAWHCVPDALGTMDAGTGVLTAGPTAVAGYVVALVSGSLRFGETGTSATGTGKVVVHPATPSGFALHQNLPNPFNPTTTIRFELREPGPVRLEVFDSSGRLARRLVAAPLAAGSHELTWDGTDDGGVPLGSGVYLVRLSAGDLVAVRKALLLR